MTWTTAVYAGSFDPVTKGHIDLIERANTTFSKVIVAVGVNLSKSALFSLETRTHFIERATMGLGVEIHSFDGLLVDFCKKHNADVIIRGLRAVTDFEAELGMSHVNKQLAPHIETFFLPCKPEYSFVSSSTVKQLAKLQADTSYYVTQEVSDALKEKFYPKNGMFSVIGT
jgi:pantetheine-phosphate adenylyltransferase